MSDRKPDPAVTPKKILKQIAEEDRQIAIEVGPNYPRLYAKQLAFESDTARYTLCEAGTKSGKTIACASWIVRKAWQNKDTIWWWIAPSYAQAMIAFDYMMHGDRMPEEANARRKGPLPALLELPYQCTIRRGGRFPQIQLWNESQIQFRTAAEPDRLYGQGIAGAVVDEASRLSEAAFHAVRSTLTMSGGPMKIIGNPRGTRNWFYKLCLIAKRGAPNYGYHHLVSKDNPFVLQSEIDDARAMLPERVFRELYLGEAQEGDGQVFGHIVRACRIDGMQKPVKGAQYVIGWDPARRVDNSAVTIFERSGEPWREVRLERLSVSSWEAQLDRIETLSKRYNGANVIFDATSLGDILGERAAKRNLPLVRFVFTAPRKNEIVNRMISALEREAIHFQASGREAEIARAEMEMFEMKPMGISGFYVYSAPPGAHDDYVMARCMALWALEGGDARASGQIIEYFREAAAQAAVAKPAADQPVQTAQSQKGKHP